MKFPEAPYWGGTLVLASIAMLGCGTTRYATQAPFDAFLCFDSSFNNCLKNSQSGQLLAFRGGTTTAETTIKDAQMKQGAAYQLRPDLPTPTHPNRARLHPPSAHAAAATEPAKPVKPVITNEQRPTPQAREPENPGLTVVNERIEDHAQGIARTTADKKYSCNYGKVPYEQQLDADKPVSAVFVSPVLLRQLGEDILRLNQARLGCDRLVERYDTHLKVLDGRDTLAKYQRGVAELSAWVEGVRLAQQKDKDGHLIGGETLDPDDASDWGLTGTPTLVDGLSMSRGNVLDEEDALRSMDRSQDVDLDYGLRFLDVQIAIDAQSRTLARTLFLLDRSVASANAVSMETSYLSGSWVSQGTVAFWSRPGLTTPPTSPNETPSPK